MALLKLVPLPLLPLVGSPPPPLSRPVHRPQVLRFPEDGFYLLFHATEHAILSREKFYLKIISYMILPFFPVSWFSSWSRLVHCIFFISAIIEVSVKFRETLKKIQKHTISLIWNSFAYCSQVFPSHEWSK